MQSGDAIKTWLKRRGIGVKDIRPEQAVESFRMLPGSRLSVLSGTDHMQVTSGTDWLEPMIGEFLDAPATK